MQTMIGYTVLRKDFRIASDGKLDRGEEEELKKIVACLSDFADDVMELRMYLKKHGGTPDGTN